MRTHRILLPFLTALLGLCLGSVPLHAAGFTWNTDASGNWSDAGYWTPTGVPYGYDDSAAIIQNPSAHVVVSIPNRVNLHSLTTGINNTVSVAGSFAELYFGKTTGASEPTLVNNGYVNLGNWGSLRVDGWQLTGYQLTISGAGTIRLSSSGSIGTVNFGQIILDIDPTFLTYNTVQGGGEELTPSGVGGWNEAIPLINRAAIFADLGYLRVEDIENQPLSWNGQTYGGILGATDSGFLILQGSIAGGYVLPGDGTVHVDGAKMRNTTLGPGTAAVTQISTFWESTTLMPGATLDILAAKRADLYNTSITNHGLIQIASGGALHVSQSQTVLQGGGTVLLVGPSGLLDADGASTNWILNGESHSIEGGGTVGAWILNSGTLLANDHTLRCNGALFGDGIMRIEGQDAANVAVIDYWAASALTTGSLHINEFGQLILHNNTNLNIMGNFTFALREESLWTLADKTLNMTGEGTWQTLEVGGEDLGLTAAGFTDNFSLGTLHIHENTLACLVDATDNGNRHSPEALYVDELILDTGAILDLNSIKLYTHISPQGSPELVMIDDINYTDYNQFFDGSFATIPSSVPGASAAGFALLQNHPNPFNPNTTITFELPEQGVISLQVFDLAGRLVRKLVDSEIYPKGRHESVWSGRDDAGRQSASGTYFYRLESGNYSETKRMVLVK